MINNVVLMGRLTYEPELKAAPSGAAVLSFQLACDRPYAAKGEKHKADFIDCVAWRQTAEFITRYFHKGSMLAVEGSIQTDSYEDSEGVRRKSTAVVCSRVSFCGAKQQVQTPSSDAEYEVME